MKVKIFEEILLIHITILLNHIPCNVIAAMASASYVPIPSHTISFSGIGTSTENMVTIMTQVHPGTNQTQSGITTQVPVKPSTSSKINWIKTTNLMLKSSTMQEITTTSIWSTSAIPKSPPTSHTLSPSISHPITNTSSPSPTHKAPKTTSSSQPFVHKVGLIVGIVLGLVLVSVCLLVFHKKEMRIKCLKLICRPCTKSYSSRYNIVPIYVYDDTEQDIRELQDDSDLPLV